MVCFTIVKEGHFPQVISAIFQILLVDMYHEYQTVLLKSIWENLIFSIRKKGQGSLR